MDYLEKQFAMVRQRIAEGRNFSDFAAGKIYVQKAFARRLRELMGPDAKYLEVGCGGSLTIHYLSEMGHSATGLDSCDTALAYTSYLSALLSSNVNAIKGDAFSLPYADDYFDCVFSIGMIEHYTKEQQLGLATEMLRVARKAVVIGVPNVNIESASYHYIAHGDEHHEECDIEEIAEALDLASIVYDGRGIFLNQSEAERNPEYLRFIRDHFPQKLRIFAESDIEDLIATELAQAPALRRKHGFVEYFVGYKH